MPGNKISFKLAVPVNFAARISASFEDKTKQHAAAACDLPLFMDAPIHTITLDLFFLLLFWPLFSFGFQITWSRVLIIFPSLSQI